MALKKTKQTQQGNSAEYWRIVQLNVNYDRPDAICVIALYLNQAARQAGASPFMTFTFDIVSEFLPAQGGIDTLKNITLQKAYIAIKALAAAEAQKPVELRNPDLLWFADAEDLL